MEDNLTSPADKIGEYKRVIKPDINMSMDQLQHAVNELQVDSFVSRFPKVDKFYADPQYHNQVYGLHSFVPSKTAVPDKDGVFGMIKFRGSFANKQEADERAEWLIKNSDSFHQIFTSYIGRPFPVTVSSTYSEDVNEIDIKKKTVETFSDDVKLKKDKGKKEVEEVKAREQELLKDVEKGTDSDPMDLYITLRVKKAQLSWTYLKTIEELKKVKDVIIKTRADLEELNASHPEFDSVYYEKYMEARKSSGLPTTDDSFIKYMMEDAQLDF